jgi:hypothetical protein
MTNTAWCILLGEHWQRFTSAQPNLEMLGTVQRGAQIGALARRIDGSYVQLNGDNLTPLGAFQIERALRRALSHAAAEPWRSLPSRPLSVSLQAVTF